jgi:hypothetical protein
MSFEVGPSGRGFTLVICDRCGRTEEYEDSRVDVVADGATEHGWDIESNDSAFCSECLRQHFTEHGVFAAADEEYRKLDDEGEQFLRDREIDIRISPSGEML